MAVIITVVVLPKKYTVL